MAWNYGALYSIRRGGRKSRIPDSHVRQHVARRGPIPPGQYPSGGPFLRSWTSGRRRETAIDIYSPDIYAPNFAEWCDRYNRAGNPLFIPEARGGATGRS